MGVRNPVAVEELSLSVGRWGNSLAVRLPAALAQALGIAEGSTLGVTRGADDSLRLRPLPAREPIDRVEWALRARAHLASMPRTESVIGEMRGDARY